MKSQQSIKWFFISASLIILVVALFARYFFQEYYLPYRRVQPILEMLDSDDLRMIKRGTLFVRGLDYDDVNKGGLMVELPNHVPLSGRESVLIERKILEVLPTIEDKFTIWSILVIIDSPQITGITHGLDFGKYGDEEWAIIRDAAFRFNEMVYSPKILQFVVQNKNGIYALQQQVTQF